MGNDKSKPDGGEEEEEEEGSIFDMCFGPRKKLDDQTPQRGSRSKPEDFVVVSGNEKDKEKNGSKRGKMKRSVTWSSSRRILNPADPEEEKLTLEDMDREMKFLKKQLRLLKSRPSSRLVMIEKHDEEKKRERDEENELLKKDFEIANLKKDLCISQLRQETMLRATKNAMLHKDKPTRDQPSSAQTDSKSEAAAKSKRESAELVQALDNQLLENALTVDEYALALANLSMSYQDAKENNVDIELSESSEDEEESHTKLNEHRKIQKKITNSLESVPEEVGSTRSVETTN